MNKDQKLTTQELEKYIRSVYKKTEVATKRDGVHQPLDDYFAQEIPNGSDGRFCFSDYEGYHYCIYERGCLRTHMIANDLTEITYHILSSDITNMAHSYERTHRISGEDSRRLLFQKILEYWEIIGVEYENFAKVELRGILERFPFTR